MLRMQRIEILELEAKITQLKPSQSEIRGGVAQ